MGERTAASTSGFGDATTQPLRMLDSLQPRAASRSAAPGRRNTWLLALGLAVLAVAGYAWWDQSVRSTVSPGLIEASRQSRAAETTTAPAVTPAPPTPTEVATTAPGGLAASAPVADPSAGPASIERTAAADAKTATVQPFASAPVPREVDPFAMKSAAVMAKPTASTPPVTTRTAAAPVPAASAALSTAAPSPAITSPAAPSPAAVPFAPTRVAAAPRTAPRPAPAVVAQAPASPSADPDVNLFSAMLTRLSGDGAATATTRPTIAQLVERCEAQSAKDSIEAFECKRRICAGYWGKADACPMALAPKRD